MKHHKTLDTISTILLLIGGICWGLVGAFNFEPISMIFGGDGGLTRIIYILIGLSALYRLFMWVQSRR